MPIKQLNSVFTTRRDLLNILTLLLVAVAIFYPLFYTVYSYTDDWYGLWQHESGKGTAVLTTYGRHLTDIIANWLYTVINARTVRDLVYIRLFSFFGWLVCIPVWYIITKKIASIENLPGQLAFLSTLYMICSPPFAICVGWSSCFEQFIANTAGLMSGYILYSSIKYEGERIVVPTLAIVFSVMVGVISLFTYQNGFGCFLFPFLFAIIARPTRFRKIVIGIGFYLFINVVYYLVFKYNLKIHGVEASGRTTIGVDVFPKLKFFFSRPLTTAFHFTYIFNERSIIGFVVYVFVFMAWLIADFNRSLSLPIIKRLKILALILFMLILVYLPSLIVKETYSSNRTLFALDMAVFFLVAGTALFALKKYKTRLVTVTLLCILFVVNAYYNFNKQFLSPVKNEYFQVRSFIEHNYDSTVKAVYFIRPHEDFFVKKYGINRSWDEFGVPSTFFNWVPEFFVKQVVFEKTGNRQLAEKLTVIQSPDTEQFADSAGVTQNTMIIDVEEILK